MAIIKRYVAKTRGFANHISKLHWKARGEAATWLCDGCMALSVVERLR